MTQTFSLFWITLFSIFSFHSAATDVATLRFDLDDCVEGEELDDYSEFNTNEIELSVIDENLFRSNPSRNQHSCTPSFNGTAAMCVSYNDTSCTFDPTDDTAVRFGVMISPVDNRAVTLSNLSFVDLAPSEYVWIGSGSGINNPPTLMAVRVLVEGEVVYQREDIPLSAEWVLNEFDFEEIDAFTINESTIFNFELSAYCAAGIEAAVNIWDLEDITISAICADIVDMPMDTMAMDTDGDGITDAGDNCPDISNPDQADFDNW